MKIYAVCWQDCTEPWGWEPIEFVWLEEEAEELLNNRLQDAALEYIRRQQHLNTDDENIVKYWKNYFAQEYSIQEYYIPDLPAPISDGVQGFAEGK